MSDTLAGISKVGGKTAGFCLRKVRISISRTRVSRAGWLARVHAPVEVK